MSPPSDPFELFLSTRKKDLQRISRATRGEHQLSDVAAEAWLMAQRWAEPGGTPIDFSEPSFQERLLAHLYQHLVRYAETQVRHAIRLDHAAPGRDEEGGVHPLMQRLASDEGRDPLALLEQRAEAQAQETRLATDSSLAAAYLQLLARCNHEMKSLAEHLLISLSYAYRRCAHARVLAVQQRPVPLPASSGLVGPWRSFRLQRVAVQLEFDFGEVALFR